MDSGHHTYELAYLLPPSLSEEEVLGVSGKLSTVVEEAGGIVSYSEKPVKRKLAYLIKKEWSAYFGWIKFSGASEMVTLIEKKLQGEAHLLRHLIVLEEEKRRRRAGIFAGRRQKPKPAEAVEKPTESKFDLEELDKKLEEILGK